ncbi:MAG: response regulator [Clostridiales bacterium]|jgi:two-component system response regulator YesN|nr:response regulator [Clostridiales bacterium]OPZ68338.1 MAG: putative response regulatory protein [Firmicutes bacterium ADurb.Bin467]
MIRVMIVEDEPHAQRRLKRMIERLDESFRIEELALDGEEALEKLKATRCDVVFTDIRMPIMDGTELMQRIRSLYPEMMLVVLSGYSDFPYVSEAVRAQAVDYLLKPLTESQLEPLLKKIKGRFLEREHELIRRKLAARINKAAPLPPGGGPATDERLLALLLCAGPLPICESTDMCPGAEFWSSAALRETVERTIRELSSFTWEFMGNAPSERIVILRSEHVDTRSIAKYLHGAIAMKADMPLSCAYHLKPISLSEIDGTLKALRKALEWRGRIGESLLIELEDAEPEFPIDDDGLFLAKACLSRAGAPELDRLFQRFRGEKWSQGAIYRLFSMAIAQIGDNSPDSYQELLRLRAALADSLSSALTMEELKGDIASLALQADGGADESSPAARRIEQYLRKNYAEHITNQTLGSVFGYVPSYVSVLFRRAYDMSPSEYLTNIRIDQAKQRMLENPNLLIRDVALLVGFKSQHHFSRTFKNREGVWPSDYLAERRQV